MSLLRFGSLGSRMVATALPQGTYPQAASVLELAQASIRWTAVGLRSFRSSTANSIVAESDTPHALQSRQPASHATSSVDTPTTSYQDVDTYSLQEDDEPFQDPASRGAALRHVLRSSNAAELAAVHFFRGLSAASRGRVDAQFFAAQEEGAAERLRGLLPRYRVRPSLAQGPLSLACMALGAAAAAAPPRVRLAVAGAVGEALTDHYNEQLRQLNEAGAAQQAPDVRQALRSLRDLPRTPDGAPAAPDLLSVLQEGVAAATSGRAGAGSGSGGGGSGVLSGVVGAVREWGVDGTVGAVVKAGARVALDAAGRM